MQYFECPIKRCGHINTLDGEKALELLEMEAEDIEWSDTEQESISYSADCECRRCQQIVMLNIIFSQNTSWSSLIRLI